MDELGLDMASRAGLGELVARHPQIVRIVGGHVHTTVIAELGGRVVVACPSTHLQLRLDLGARTELRLDRLPPAFALHRYENGEMTTLIRPVRVRPPRSGAGANAGRRRPRGRPSSRRALPA